ncbi:restriction endonuclease subunit S [Trueperella pyogenes]|uniref:restriction endonuclease subunit S n=2 Tax=Trueperella pyogenes TaxID=1661 RepID=UPI0009B864AF
MKNGENYKHLSPGEIPVYGSGGIMTPVDQASFDGPSVLLPRKGSISNVFYVDEPFWNVDTIYYTKINDQLVIPKFLYYVLANARVEKLNASDDARPVPRARDCPELNGISTSRMPLGRRPRADDR